MRVRNFAWQWYNYNQCNQIQISQGYIIGNIIDNSFRIILGFLISSSHLLASLPVYMFTDAKVYEYMYVNPGSQSKISNAASKITWRQKSQHRFLISIQFTMPGRRRCLCISFYHYLPSILGATIRRKITNNFLITLTTKLTLLREKLKTNWFIPGGPKTHDCTVSIPRFIPK